MFNASLARKSNAREILLFLFFFLNFPCMYLYFVGDHHKVTSVTVWVVFSRFQDLIVTDREIVSPFYLGTLYGYLRYTLKIGHFQS